MAFLAPLAFGAAATTGTVAATTAATTGLFGAGGAFSLAQTLSTVGTLLSAAGSYKQGQSAKIIAEHEADVAEQQAGEERAVSQRRAAEASRQSRIRQSRALAVAAASGGGADDPTVVNLVSGLAEQGAYQSQIALYEGEETAKGLEWTAASKRAQGEAAADAGLISAAATLAGGVADNAGSLTSKYDPGIEEVATESFEYTGLTPIESFSGSTNYDWRLP